MLGHGTIWRALRLGHRHLDVDTAHETTRHMLPVTRVAFDHHEDRLEGKRAVFCHRDLLMVGFLRWNDRGV